MPLNLTDGVIRIPSDQKVDSLKKRLLDHFVSERGRDGFPKSYSTNSAKEDTILEYVEDFRRQFVQVFPERRPLLLCPKNEVGVRKFVCTSVRPSQLPYNQIYDLTAAAEFVADFFKYLPMENPSSLPASLPSPTTTIDLRAGDSLDLANLLCGVLRGNGFNAYVVSGYAPKFITTKDQSKSYCSILDSTALVMEEDEDEKDDDAGEAGGDREDVGEGEDNTRGSKEVKYKKKPQPKHESKYLAQLDQEEQEEDDEAARVDESKAQYVHTAKIDSLHGNRVHFWVLVMKGRREVVEHTYVEPTTGKLWPVKESPYLGIESVWNEHNYWTNVQEATPQEISFELSHSSCWEYVLIDEKKTTEEDAGDPLTQFDTVDDSAGGELPPEEIIDDRDILDCPMSWCKRIVIPRKLFTEAFPGGSRITHYKRSTVEKFADYFPGKSGLVLRVTLFQTDDCITAVEVREFFRHRKDRLYQRYTHPLEGRTHEFFEPGRTYGLKEYIRVEDKKRYFTFYSSSREDGLARRDELIGVKVVEEFEDRDDLLVYRSVRVISKEDQSKLKGKGGGMGRDSRNKITLAKCQEAPVRKITEKFARDPRKQSAVDVRKRTHFVSEAKIRLDYHYADRAITAPTLTLDKSDKLMGNEMDITADYGRNGSAGDRKGSQQSKELLTKLIQKEKDLTNKVKERELHVDQLLSTLETDADRERKQRDHLDKSIYDLAHEQASQVDDDQEDGVQDEDHGRNKVDYLSPFLAQYGNGNGTKPLTKRQAMTAKDECLATLKERLLERASIIQKHLDMENQKLQQRRQLFKRQTGSGAVEADEDFTKFYQESAFRIDILKARLQRHEELALQKYVEMDQRLNKDSRLAVLNQAD